MPLFAPVLSESKKFLDPMQDARIIQRSEWLFELEIPIRDDMLPGMIFLKEYGGRYTVKLELLHKKFPDGYLFTDEFKAMAADQHVYINKHDHERWLKNFMNPKEKRAPTPTKTPPYSSKQIISDTPAQGPFCHHKCEGPLYTSKYPEHIDPFTLDQHPKEGKVHYDYGECRPVRTRIGLPPQEPSPFPRDEPSTSATQGDDMEVSPPPSEVTTREVVGGSGTDQSVDTYTLDEMLTWPFKRLGNRRSRLVKVQKKAKESGKLHLFALVTEQLQLLTKAQRINKFGSFAPESKKKKKNVDLDDSDNDDVSSVVAEARARKGVPPPLKRPGTIYPTRKQIIAQREAQKSVCNLAPPRPPKPNLLIAPSLPPKSIIFINDNNRLPEVEHVNLKQFDFDANIDPCSFFDEEPKILKRLSARSKKPKRLTTKRPLQGPKSKPVHRSCPPVEILSPTFNSGGFNISGCSEESTAFSQGSPTDPKIYLGGRFSDQSEPDSPTTAARINARALWYEPCTRLEYRYKFKAWRAEGLPGRPTNSPLKFSIPFN